ncbi:DUF456 family protein [Xylanibacillus composti]|uniref:DUF456 family protein n=1 Tax=Xylanibacillus composti TaxID=1572762 RepID=A0A8J4H071_9BACL|nr:DUF456 family protein [Xylanibacillus composti]MDT9723520.1 DUF456 family protein [Xylanibacillus composti]GIQ68444.1 hypothetical protein XYCOK13_12680 [Xylanibacillus composti]
MVDVLGWILVILLFVIGMAGAVYPVLPGVLAIYAAFFVYGGFFGFGALNWWFWIIQTLIVLVLFAADYLVSSYGIDRSGGSKQAFWGSTIGLILGPFVIPAFGLVIGPFVGAAAGELLHGSSWSKAMRIGWVTLVSLFASTVVKVLLQGMMIVLFAFWLFFA